MAQAQQSRVDSVIVLLNKSIINEQLDSANFSVAIDLLRNTDLTAAQIKEIESTTDQFQKWEKDGWPFEVKHFLFNGLFTVDFDESISYGKLQVEKIDQLNTLEASAMRGAFLTNLRIPFRNSNRLEDGLVYFSQKLNHYKTQNDSVSIAMCHYVLAGFNDISGLTNLAIYNMKKSISYIDTVSNKSRWLNNVGVLGTYYLRKEDKSDGLKFLKIALEENIKLGDGYFFSAINLAAIKLQTNQLDSAAYYLSIAKRDPELANSGPFAAYLQIQALYFIQTGNLDVAEKNLIELWDLIRARSIPVSGGTGTIAPDYYLALIRIKQNKFEEAIQLLQLDIERLNNNRKEILRDTKLIAKLYQRTGKSELAAETYTRFIVLQDSLLADQDKFRSISFEAEQQMNENALAIERLESQNQLSTTTRNFSIGIVVLLLILSASIYYRFQSKKKANEALNKTLANLKSTQTQLIQSEKMASLGELTAGIAHEIQNPLNFVNNFSEVSNELIDEVEDERAKSPETRDEKLISQTLADLKENLSKINHHGKRADFIVKGMLEHSRTNARDVKPTNLNTLADEFLRLSYHGLRAKDKSFNADFETDLDPNLPKVNVVAQDIGRVILNLINNAFYAVNERKSKLSQSSELWESYKPTVKVSSRLVDLAGEGGVEISIVDNGSGIPKAIKDKIFQPFFTTKPTGSGTGLGLSLSYDIIKAHGGDLHVKSIEGEGTEMIFFLPIKEKNK
jgi:signal transduction histidine kinase